MCPKNLYSKNLGQGERASIWDSLSRSIAAVTKAFTPENGYNSTQPVPGLRLHPRRDEPLLDQVSKQSIYWLYNDQNERIRIIISWHLLWRRCVLCAYDEKKLCSGVIDEKFLFDNVKWINSKWTVNEQQVNQFLIRDIPLVQCFSNVGTRDCIDWYAQHKYKI